jgi:hypothetical protein
MNARALKLLAVVAVVVGGLVAGVAIAADVPAAGPLRDPWVPPSLRKASPVAPSTGATLQEQVRAKLKASFEAAAVDGMLTLDQARRAGLGHIAHNFARIDTSGRGRITFDDYLRYLRAQGAEL